MKKRFTIICALLVPMLFIGTSAIYAQTAISEWGDIGNRLLGGGWTIENTATTPAGEVHISGDAAPGNWTAVRGAFGETVTASTGNALIVSGKLEFAGASLEGWNPLRYGVFNHLNSDSLRYAETDSAQWGYIQYAGTDSAAFVSDEANAQGYLITNTVGANDAVSGQGGIGSAWAVNGGSWLSTWSGGTDAMGHINPAPRRAIMEPGVYDFAMSAEPLADGTTEFRWYLVSEDGTSYWQAGTHIDTTAQKTDFNGVTFSMQDGIEGVTSISLTGVEYQLGSSITIPEKPFDSFYIDQWGDIGNRLLGGGWTIDNDTTTLVGDAYLSGDAPPGNWTAVRGGFGESVEATTEEALIVTGEFEIIGGDIDSWNPLRFGVFQHNDIGSLNNQYTDSAQWGYTQYAGTDSATFVSNEADAYGYLFTNRTGANDAVSGQGGIGIAWAVNGGSWLSTWSGGTDAMGHFDQAPRRAIMAEGLYEFEISVQPLADGTNEVRWYILSEDGESYWHGGTHIDTTMQKTEFNGFTFSMQDGIEDITGINLYAVQVNKGNPIDIPPPPFSPFYVDTWGFLGGKLGGTSDTDSAWALTPGALVGDVSFGGPAATGWANVSGYFGGNHVVPAENKALLITGDVTFEGGGFDEEDSFRFGLFNSDLGSQDSTEAVGYVWSGDETANGYLISPSATNGTISSVSGGSWYVGESTISDYTTSGTPTDGTYELTMAVYPNANGGTEVAAKLEKNDGSYKYEINATDDTSPAVETAFNSVIFGTNNSTTTGIAIEALYVELVDPSEISVSVDDVNAGLPSRFALNQNYPNPFNPTTKISFDLPLNADVQLEVYNMLGQKVMTLVNRRMEAGSHQVTFDARNLASGMYVYRIEAGNFVSTKKMMLIK